MYEIKKDKFFNINIMEINIIDSCSKIFTFCSGNLATYKDEKTTTKMEGDKNGR